ncbi:MAG: McrC family protein [Fimbriimonadaceae bacterium]|nr:McrC family protein [Fimbriimonadaceae bacterium]
MASQKIWNGSRAENGNEPSSSAIQCEPYGFGQWKVQVPNAIGVLRVADLELVIQPKIPLEHVLYLFGRSGAFPQIDRAAVAELGSARDLWTLTATWFVSALERLMRSGLASGYKPRSEVLPLARGRIDPLRTIRLITRGVPAMHCDYEEFDSDTPLNRALKAAALAVSSSAVLTWELRRRARLLVEQLPEVGPLRPGDLGMLIVERHTARYRLPISLALHVISSTGRNIDSGTEHGYGFLIRTPEMVEEALRRICEEALRDRINVSKKTRYLRGSHHSLTPDLVFGDIAVGDAKYKIWDGDWPRPDLYQLVTFATGFGKKHALRVGFSESRSFGPAVKVGNVTLNVCDWMLGTDRPEESEQVFGTDLRRWLELVATGTP